MSHTQSYVKFKDVTTMKPTEDLAETQDHHVEETYRGETTIAANDADCEVNDDRHGMYVEDLEYNLDITRELPKDDHDESFPCK